MCTHITLFSIHFMSSSRPNFKYLKMIAVAIVLYLIKPTHHVSFYTYAKILLDQTKCQVKVTTKQILRASKMLKTRLPATSYSLLFWWIKQDIFNIFSIFLWDINFQFNIIIISRWMVSLRTNLFFYSSRIVWSLNSYTAIRILHLQLSRY